MNINLTQKQGRVPVTVLQLTGKLDGSNYMQLVEEARRNYLNGVHDLLIDMSHLTYLFRGLEGHNMIANWMTVSAATAVVAFVLLIIPKARTREPILALACGLTFLSLWIEKGLGLVITGFIPSPLEAITDYVPTGPEIAISVGVWALGLLLITIFYKIFVSVRTET